MAYTFVPNGSYKTATKLNDAGESVAVLQLNLVEWGMSTVSVDGSFGPSTESAVKIVQQKKGLIVDGIAGPATQRALCLDLMGPAHDQYNTPTGFLRGMCEHESGYILAAYAPHPSDPGFDLGSFQQSFPPRDQTQLNFRHAYNAKLTAFDAASASRTLKDSFRQAPYAQSDELAWKYAALYHNWPFAASNLAWNGHIYPSDPAMDSQPAQWVINASGGTLSTPLQWANYYSAQVCRYVTYFNP